MSKPVRPSGRVTPFPGSQRCFLVIHIRAARGHRPSGMRHSFGLDGVRYSPRLGALLGFVLVIGVLIVLGLVLGIAFARVQPVQLVEFVAACEFLNYGGIPHVYLSFPRAPKECGETRSIVSAQHDRYRNLRKCRMWPVRPGPSPPPRGRRVR